MAIPSFEGKKDVSLVLCGEAGQGIESLGRFLVRMFKRSGMNVFATREFMSRVRGGSNSTQIRVSSSRVSAPLRRIDILVYFGEKALEHVRGRVSADTLIMGDASVPHSKGDEELSIVDIPFLRMASDIGGAIYANMVAAGTVSGLFDLDEDRLVASVRDFFSSNDADIVEKNVKAVKAGRKTAVELLTGRTGKIEAYTNEKVADELVLSGTEAVGMGAIAGGCNFVTAYPMSPSTGVLTFLSKNADEFGIVAEQAEDEISAINMALGAWYGGARAIVTTSGGGFALMEEGISLAGISETPVVIHLAQRPGPATGLATRTEQGDLNLALHAGHGEFPRIIYAPGTVDEAFHLTFRAFDLADKYQVPVIILTDQYMMDSNYNTGLEGFADIEPGRFFIKTDVNYVRYLLTEEGVSPRGIPGFGEGLVVADSHEHTEDGHMTENLLLRPGMVKKRLGKLSGIMDEVVEPKLEGPEIYENLVVGWGSTYHSIREALIHLERKDLAFLHFSQVYPVPAVAEGYLKNAKRIVVVEGNATSQFAGLLEAVTGCRVHESILKYDGLQFFVEDVEEGIKRALSMEV